MNDNKIYRRMVISLSQNVLFIHNDCLDISAYFQRDIQNLVQSKPFKYIKVRLMSFADTEYVIL